MCRDDWCCDTRQGMMSLGHLWGTAPCDIYKWWWQLDLYYLVLLVLATAVLNTAELSTEPAVSSWSKVCLDSLTLVRFLCACVAYAEMIHKKVWHHQDICGNSTNPVTGASKAVAPLLKRRVLLVVVVVVVVLWLATSRWRVSLDLSQDVLYIY